MKALNRKHKTYRLNDLPELSSFSFKYNENHGYTGSIVRRRLNGKGPLWHYAFIYGFARHNDELLLVENNEDGVEAVSWPDFMAGASEFEIVYYEKDPGKYKQIMLRAYERCNEKYSAHDNNCEHFCNYCVHGRFESFQTDIIKKAADAVLCSLEMQSIHSNSQGLEQLLNTYNEIRIQFNLERKNEGLNELIEVKLKTQKKEP